MKIIVKKSLDKKYFIDVVHSVNKIVKIPNEAVFYIIERKSDCNGIIKLLPEKSKKDFIEICSKNISFSYHHKNIKYMIIDIKNEDYLLYDRDALMGLILHEIMHIKTSNLFDKRINKDLKGVLFKNIDKLKIREKVFNDVIEVMNYSRLLLKELYANEALIKKNLSNYLLKYYYQQFSKRRDSNILYDKKFKNDKDFVKNILKFELSLCSVIWPLEKFKVYDYDLLLKYIQDNYNVKLRKIEKKFKLLKNLYFRSFNNTKFNTLFFEGALDILNRKLK